MGGQWAELVSIDGIAAARIVAFCKERYPRPADTQWRKRFTEDLVEVMTGLERPPAAQITLVLASLPDGRRSTVQAEMTHDNRQRLWRANNHMTDVSPFTGLKYEGDAIRVQLDGSWYRLLRMAGVPTERLVAFAKERFGALWNKRVAEDPVMVLAALGVKPAPTVDLLLLDLTTGNQVERPGVPMTRENRQKVWRTWGPR